MTDPTPRARIPLSVPHLTGHELDALGRALASNWIAPIGPEVDAFEAEFAAALGLPHALATTSGTAALHLALRVLDVGPGDEVLVSTLTFCATINPILYMGATPVFVDAEPLGWNADPALLCDELDRRGRAGTLPAAVIVAHLYGQCADLQPVALACRRWGVPLIEDAAEALGAALTDADGTLRPAGTIGDLAIFSFDGAKMITTSMGGMLVSRDGARIAHARTLARQAREPVPYYEHEEIGYNYRLSNLLAAVGRPQLSALPARVAARRAVARRYAERLADAECVQLQAEAPWGHHARWLSCVTLATAEPERVRRRLADAGIETRHVWKPMHLQPVHRRAAFPVLGGAVSESLFATGLCLPSSSSLTPAEVDEVCARLLQYAADA